MPFQVRPQPRLQALTVEREVEEQEDIGVGESEDEFGDEEEGRGQCEAKVTTNMTSNRADSRLVPSQWETTLLLIGWTQT